MTTAERFWSKVDKKGSDECWNWTAGKRHGYGEFCIGDGKQMPAHRLAWELHYDQKVPKDMQILHHCDNPSCCNHNHLYCGTQSDNLVDMAIRGRGRRSKMSAATILLVRGLQKFGLSLKHAAMLAEVSKGQVYSIWNSKRYHPIEGAVI